MAESININNIRKSYSSGKEVLCGVSLQIAAGEIFGFLGPNGAGKTTTIKLLLGFLTPDQGTVRICGQDPTIADVRKNLGYLPEVAYYYEFLKIRELLKFYGKLCSMPKKLLQERIEYVIDLVGLEDAGNKPLKSYSKGMRQRAGIAQALLHDPQILILDEPMTGLDPIGRNKIKNIIKEQKEMGKTVFFSSHELSEAEMICDKVAILKAGQICWHGSVKDLAGDGSANLERIFLAQIDKGGK